MTDSFSFGYPEQCTKCASISPNLHCQLVGLKVGPFIQQGGGLKVMLIGQDPTIFRKPERVKKALMLDQPNAQLKCWLKDLFGDRNFQSLTLYATNLVKCTYSAPPSTAPGGGLEILRPYFENCREYLVEELLTFQPRVVLTLGEPTHQLFVSLLDNRDVIPDNMQKAFTGQFTKARFKGFEFDYSPCLHIKTFRVAEVYGEKVQAFKRGVLAYFDEQARDESS